MRFAERWAEMLAPVMERTVLVTLLLVAAGLWGFLELAEEIREGDQFSLDRTILLLLRNPVDVETRVLLAAALMAMGDHAAAKWEADEIRSLQPEFSIRAWLATYPMTSSRQRQRLVTLFAKLES